MAYDLSYGSIENQITIFFSFLEDLGAEKSLIKEYIIKCVVRIRTRIR